MRAILAAVQSRSVAGGEGGPWQRGPPSRMHREDLPATVLVDARSWESKRGGQEQAHERSLRTG